MDLHRRAAILAASVALLAACASSGSDVEYAYDVDWIPEYTRQKPPKCPYEEVGSLDIRGSVYGGSFDRMGGEKLERRRHSQERRDAEIRAAMRETGADAIFLHRYPRRPMVLIRFTDPECLG